MDWKSLIAEIQAHSLSQAQIAAVCGCGQATISDLASGRAKEPRYSLGVALEALLARAKAEKAAEAAAPTASTEPAKASA